MVFPSKKHPSSTTFSEEYKAILKQLSKKGIFSPEKTSFSYSIMQQKDFKLHPLEDNTLLQQQTLLNILEFHAKTQPHKTAFIYLSDDNKKEEKLTFNELHTKAKIIGSYIQQNNLNKNPILLLHPPGLEFIIDFFGCIYGGAISVPLFPPKKNKKQDRFNNIIESTNAKTAFTTEKILNQINTDSNQLKHSNNIQFISLQNLNPKLAKKWKNPKLSPHDIAFIQFTSGSTSKPKGVINTHHNIITNEEMIRNAANTSKNTRVCGWGPHYHDLGIIANILHPIYVGCLSVLMSPTSFIQKPFRWLKTISDYQITYSGGPNFAYDLCIDKITKSELQELNLSSWNVAFNGAEPIKAETLLKFEKKFQQCHFSKTAFFPLYGLAETTVFCTGNHASEKPSFLSVDKEALAKNKIEKPKKPLNEKKLVCCGKTWGKQIVKIIDTNSMTESPKNWVGEIWVQGENVSQGYWNEPNLTKDAFKASIINTQEGPFFRTGDLGFLTNDNKLFVTGRIKDMIIIHGKNIYPHDIENEIETICNKIKNGGCAVFEYEQTNTQSLVAVIEIERTQLKSFDPAALNEKIANFVLAEFGFSLNDIIYIKPMSLPKTSSGKKQRQLCKKLYLNNNLATISDHKFNQSNTKKNETIPLTHTEKILTQIIKNLLNISHFPMSSKLAYLGGNSLISIQMIIEIQKQFGIEITTNELYKKNITIKSLCQLIDTKQNILIQELTNKQHTQQHSIQLTNTTV
tara:strand:- start:13151 stop:15379 length:2229 start_codon:yes stop_codon:yes gene_type:complete